MTGYLSAFTVSLVLVFSGAVMPKMAHADELQVAYKTFYSHVRKLDSQETEALQFAFGFINIHTQKLCGITGARISTQKQQIPIQVSKENRFTLPSERALRMADALVILQLVEASNICDISVQLETKADFVKDKYSSQELLMLLTQYETFFDDIGGFLSFMMPKVDGLTIQFLDDTLSAVTNNGMKIENGRLLISAAEIQNVKELVLPQIPLRITASTSK